MSSLILNYLHVEMPSSRKFKGGSIKKLDGCTCIHTYVIVFIALYIHKERPYLPIKTPVNDQILLILGA